MEFIINEAALGPFITFIFSVILGLYVYNLNHEYITNKIFIIFMFSMSLLTFLDFGQIIIIDENIALILARLKYSCLLFVPSTFIHLSYALSDDKSIIGFKEFILIPYIFCGLFLIITNFTDYIVSGVTFDKNTYSTDYGFFNPILLICAIIFLIIGLVLLVITFKSTKNNEKKIQLKYIFIGMTITAVIMFIVTQIISRIIGFDIPGAIVLTFPMFLAYTYAIVKYRLLEVPELVTESIDAGPIDYKLEPGYTYLIKESQPTKGFKLFGKAVSEGSHGICIMSKNPKTIRQKYGLKRTPIIWITEKDDPKEITVAPDEISTISELLRPFIDSSKNSVVLLVDDYSITKGLVGVESRHRILEISKNIFDTITHQNSRFIISSRPGSTTSGKPGSITKTRRPLLEFNRLASFVLEETCNNILSHLIKTGAVTSEKLNTRLNTLASRDSFYLNKVKTNIKGNIFSTANGTANFIKIKSGLSKEMVIDKTKSFISVFDDLPHAETLNGIALKTLTKYGFSESEYLFHTGDTYIIKEPKSKYSFEIFSEFLSKDYKGLGITKSNPKKVIRTYNLSSRNLKMFWLTDIPSSEDNTIYPKLENISAEIERFLRETPDKKAIIFDGIEYLITYSGDMFDSVLRSLRKLTDRISMSNACLIIPLDPTVVSKERMALLSRSGIEIIKPP